MEAQSNQYNIPRSRCVDSFITRGVQFWALLLYDSVGYKYIYLYQALRSMLQTNILAVFLETSVGQAIQSENLKGSICFIPTQKVHKIHHFESSFQTCFHVDTDTCVCALFQYGFFKKMPHIFKIIRIIADYDKS